MATLVLGASFASITTLAAPAAPQGADPAATEVRALLRDGSWIDGRLMKADSSVLAIRRSGGPADSPALEIGRDDVVACLVDADRLHSLAFFTQMSAGTMVLSDGQLLPGSLRTDASPARWEHRWIGAVPLDPERISEIRLVASRRAPRRPDSDSILLQNGDVVFGFIESIDDEVAVDSTESGPAASDAAAEPADGAQAKGKQQENAANRRIQAERIAAMAFATLDAPPSSAALLWTTDGTIVRATDVVFEQDAGWRFLLADALLLGAGEAKPIGTAVAKPTAILFDSASITPLAACGPPEHRATESAYRYETAAQTRIEPPEQALLGLGTIEFDGPTHASFRLPASLSSAGLVFTAEIALVEPVPPDARTTVRVRFSGTEGESVTLDSANRRAMIGLKHRVGADTALEVIVDDGGNGTAGDRVALGRACFLRQR